MFKSWFHGLMSLVYPQVCGGCGGYLVEGEREICTQCKYDLSKTNFHKEPGNDAEKLFWNKVSVQHATAYCYFHKGGIAQQMLHNLKYNGAPKLGVEMGKLIGGAIKGYPVADIDYIVPVPLHPSKLKSRKYNQAQKIAEGISYVIGVPIDTTTLVRVRKNTTQTTKNINERYLNSQGLFEITDSRVLENKRVLLIDDVITTGATLEACAKELLKIDGIRVNCAAFAIAAH